MSERKPELSILKSMSLVRGSMTCSDVARSSRPWCFGCLLLAFSDETISFAVRWLKFIFPEARFFSKERPKPPCLTKPAPTKSSSSLYSSSKFSSNSSSDSIPALPSPRSPHFALGDIVTTWAFVGGACFG